MAGLFLHMEDASNELGERGVPEGGYDESETSTAAIEELRQEEAEIIETNNDAEELDDNVELAEDITEEVEPVVTEGKGLDKVAMGLTIAAMRKIAGPRYKHLVGRNIKMEAIDAGPSGRLEQSKLVLEDLKDTLKQAWAAIKAAFKKAWAKIKTWYIKTFDASKKLKARAEKIRNRAEVSSATIDKKTFTFSGAKSIAVEGSSRNAGKFVTAFAHVKELSSTILNKVKTDEVGKVAEEVANLLGDVSAKSLTGAVDTLRSKVADKCGPTVSGGKLEDKVKASFGDAKEIDVTASSELPGGKAVVKIKGKSGGNEAEEIASIRRTRFTFSNVKDKPKEVSGETETLTTSQVAKVCEYVIEIADNVFDFKKGWENRDKDTNQLVTSIDKAFNDIKKDDEVGNPAQRNARGLASAATGILRRDSAFKASFVSYAMSVSGIALSYCEGSLRQMKK